MEIYALPRISITPKSMPPIIAPGIEPIPPKTAAVNAFMPGIEPVVGINTGYAEQSRTPAIAAKALPIAKVIEMVRLVFMPISKAASLSSDTARIALPILPFLVKKVSPTIISTQAATVTSDSGVIISLPSNSEIDLNGTTDVNARGVLPQIISAAFCKK